MGLTVYTEKHFNFKASCPVMRERLFLKVMKSRVFESEQALMKDMQSHRTQVPYSPSEGWRNSPRLTGAHAPSSHSLSHQVTSASRGQSLFDQEMMKESIPLVKGWHMWGWRALSLLESCSVILWKHKWAPRLGDYHLQAITCYACLSCWGTS